MQKAFIIFLSFLLLANAGFAIIIEEIDDADTISVNLPEEINISVALIRDYIDQKADSIANTIDQQTDAKLAELNTQIEETVDSIRLKIALGVLTLCLFNFNMFLASKLLIGLVFKDA